MTFTKYPGQTNTLKFVQFDITIENSFGADSFIDHMSAFSYDPKPETLERSINIVKSNIRYDRIIVNISENATPVFIEHIDNGGATAEDDGSEFSFCVTFDRLPTVYTFDENGEIIDDPILALKRQVARALVASYSENRQIFDPTQSEGVAKNSDRQDRVDAEALADDISEAEAAITVVMHHGLSEPV